MKFPYIVERGKLMPIIPIELRYKEEWFEFEAYVDSGAGYSIFHSDVADILGLEIERGKRGYVTVGDGSQIPVYYHNVNTRISEYEFKATIGFSKRLGIGFNILGQKDIFDRFKVCFDNNEWIVEFHPHNK